MNIDPKYHTLIPVIVGILLAGFIVGDINKLTGSLQDV